MFDENAILKNGDLRAIAGLTHDHDPLNRLTSGEELRLGEDRRSASTGVATFTAALSLGLETGGTLERRGLLGA